MPKSLLSVSKRISVLGLAVFCLLASGCDRKAEKPVEPQKTETNTAAGKTALTVPVVPNPSFEQGTEGKPLGWSGVGKVALSQGDAADGSQYVSVSSGAAPKKEGGIEEEIGWLSDPVSLEPGTAYELRFRCRYRPETLFAPTNAFVGPECARLLIPLEGSQLVSPWRSYSVRFVAPSAPPDNAQRIFLGQYQLKGTIDYDGIELYPIELAESSVDGMLLGQGERIAGNNYSFTAPFGDKAFRNVSRALESCNNVFHENRWRFSNPGDSVVYRHEIAGRKQLSAALSLSVMFHEPTSWGLGVEVSTNGKDFRKVATIKQDSPTKVTIPADLLPASTVWVRLSNDTTDNAKPSFFQVTGYEYTATLDGAPLTATGRTAALTVLGEDAGVEVQPLASNSAQAVFSLTARNVGKMPIEISPALAVSHDNSEEKTYSGVPAKLAPGETANVAIPYSTASAGVYNLEFTLGKNLNTRLAATTYVPIIDANNYGELLPPASPGVGLWWASSGWKVNRTRALPTAKGDAVRISVAGNEAESAQLVVRPETALTGLTATAGELRSASGAVLPANATEVLRVGYVKVEIASDEFGSVGDWPDPLPPWKTAGIKVPAGQNQPLWIQVKAPANTPPGVYRGQITVKADGYESSVPLEVEVFGFSLPDTTTCRTLFGLNASRIWNYQRLQNDADKRAVWAKYLRLFSDHRISPYDPAPLDGFTYKFSIGHDFWEGAKISEDLFHDGAKALLVEDKTPTGNPQVSSSHPITLTGKPLKISLWYQTAKPDQAAQVILAFLDGAGEHLAGQNILLDLPSATSWTRFEKAIATIPKGATALRLSFQASPWTEKGESLGRLWVDEISLKDSGNGRELITDGSMETGKPAGKTPEVAFDWTAWDAAMTEAIDVYHFNSFLLGVPGLGAGTFHDKVAGSLAGYPMGTPEHRALFRAWCAAARSHLEPKGWLDRAVCYPFDEPAEKDYPFVIAQLRLLKEDFPGLRRMVPMNHGSAHDFVNWVDYWCPILNSFDPVFARERQKAGDIFTWYICTAPRAPYIAAFIDRPATDLRVWLWQSWQSHIEGILLWETNWWTSSLAYPDTRQNPYEDSMSWMEGYGVARGEKRPWAVGDGRLIYPPEACFDGGEDPVLDGPVSSIRLEAQRDGIEDYEYLAMLKKLLAEKRDALTPEKVASYEKILEVPREITAGLTSYTTNPAPIAARRQKVAKAIEELTR
ncbi:MAG: DUF6067 family protein [Verrucomicrobia bacterium]|nr:DUF6067 family protein [Verrucomicrobiota bacterium]